MDELELRHAEAHYAEMPRDGYSGRCEMLLPEDLRGMRVLDLGCRNGKGACKLADRVGPDGFVLGVDPSAACVARAEATAAAARAEGVAWAGRLAFARGCFEGLRAAGVEDASFDVVIVNSVLNLAWDLEEALRETARALAPGGFRPLPCRRSRVPATCSAPLAPKANSPASPWIALASPRALSSASAPSNPTAPTPPKSCAAGRSRPPSPARGANEHEDLLVAHERGGDGRLLLHALRHALEVGRRI